MTKNKIKYFYNLIHIFVIKLLYMLGYNWKYIEQVINQT